MLSVLVVEDDDLLQESLVTTFELAGYTATGVADGKEALEQVRVAPPDLIVCDHVLPSMSGLHLLHSVREVPGLEEIPFFVISVYQSAAFRKTCQLAGATDVFCKPFTVTDLLATVKQHVC